MLTYEQKSGIFRDNHQVIGIGYAGKGPGKNNPEMQEIHNVGPLPRGRYTLEQYAIRPHLGPSIYLRPEAGNIMFDRGGFFIHLDNPAHFGESSEGCPVVGRSAFNLLLHYIDQHLEVVA